MSFRDIDQAGRDHFSLKEKVSTPKSGFISVCRTMYKVNFTSVLLHLCHPNSRAGFAASLNSLHLHVHLLLHQLNSAIKCIFISVNNDVDGRHLFPIRYSPFPICSNVNLRCLLSNTNSTHTAPVPNPLPSTTSRPWRHGAYRARQLRRLFLSRSFH